MGGYNTKRKVIYGRLLVQGRSKGMRDKWARELRAEGANGVQSSDMGGKSAVSHSAPTVVNSQTHCGCAVTYFEAAVQTDPCATYVDVAVQTDPDETYVDGSGETDVEEKQSDVEPEEDIYKGYRIAVVKLENKFNTEQRNLQQERKIGFNEVRKK